MIGLAVRRPVGALLATAATAGIGLAALPGTPLALLPAVDAPRLEVRTEWPGASPEAVEARLTAPIESAARAVRGVASVASVSRPGLSEVEVTLRPGARTAFARIELVERTAVLARTFPPDAGRPVVEPAVPPELAGDLDGLLALTLVGPGGPAALRETAEDALRPALLRVPGVDAVAVLGGADRLARIVVDPDRLAAAGLGARDVGAEIDAAIDPPAPGGALRRDGREWSLALAAPVPSLADVEAVVLGPSRGTRPAVRVADVGRAEVTPAPLPYRYRIDGASAVSLRVHAARGANAVRLAAAARARARAAVDDLPPGHRLIVARDGGAEIAAGLADLGRRVALSTLAALAVLLVAFRRARAPLLALGSLAAGVAIGFGAIRAAGLSLDLLTLAGFGMGIGVAIDHPIVVLDEVHRRRARGDPPVVAAARGARRVALPLLAAAATTVVALAPFVYLQGELRAWYVPFAATVAVVLAACLAVSLTALPAVAALTAGPRPDRGSSGVRRAARPIVAATLRRPASTALGAALAIAASGALFLDRVPRGDAWEALDPDDALSILVRREPGSPLDDTDAIVRAIEARLAAATGVARFVSHVLPEDAHVRIELADSLAGTSVPLALREDLAGWVRRFGGAEVRVVGRGPSFQGAAAPRYGVRLRGSSYRELERLADDVAGRLRRTPHIVDVDPNASGAWFERRAAVEMALVPDRDRLAARDLVVTGFLDRIAARAGPRRTAAVVEVDGARLPLEVVVPGPGADPDAPLDVGALLALLVERGSGGPVRVADLARAEPRRLPARIVRRDQSYERVVAWRYRGPPRLGDRVRDAVVAGTRPPPGASIEAEDRPEPGETGRLLLVALLAVVFVHAVTAALFESWSAPLVVLAAVPAALAGVAGAWLVTGETFGREGWIGAVLAIGIAVNAAILVVDRIGSLARSGGRTPASVREAALEGTLERARPVLLTTATTVLGALPLAVATDPGSSRLWRSLALATTGGVLASTAFVLVVVPCLWTLATSPPRDRRGRRPSGTGSRPGRSSSRPGPSGRRRRAPLGSGAPPRPARGPAGPPP